MFHFFETVRKDGFYFMSGDEHREIICLPKAVSLNEPATLKLTEDLPKIDGATALYPLDVAFVQATYPQKDYPIYNSEVMCTR